MHLYRSKGAACKRRKTGAAHAGTRMAMTEDLERPKRTCSPFLLGFSISLTPRNLCSHLMLSARSHRHRGTERRERLGVQSPRVHAKLRQGIHQGGRGRAPAQAKAGKGRGRQRPMPAEAAVANFPTSTESASHRWHVRGLSPSLVSFSFCAVSLRTREGPSPQILHAPC